MTAITTWFCTRCSKAVAEGVWHECPKEGLGGVAPSASQHQVGGNHYKDMKIQPIEFTLANGLGFCEGNVIKYVSRWKNKNGVEDLRKAKHYIELLIDKVLADGD